jgi:hypothetical protein
MNHINSTASNQERIMSTRKEGANLIERSANFRLRHGPGGPGPLAIEDPVGGSSFL